MHIVTSTALKCLLVTVALVTVLAGLMALASLIP